MLVLFSLTVNLSLLIARIAFVLFLFQFLFYFLTVSLLLLIARIAAMKNVLSPISETRITDKDSTKPCRKPEERTVYFQFQFSCQSVCHCLFSNGTSMFCDIKSGLLLCNTDIGHTTTMGCLRDPCGIHILWTWINVEDLEQENIKKIKKGN